MENNRLGFGVLGCRVIGPRHAEAIATSQEEQATLVAMAGSVPERTERLAGRYVMTACHYYWPMMPLM